jgi:hypothetical protein
MTGRLAAVLSLLAAAGCVHERATRASAPGSRWVVTTSGIGPLHAGMTVAEAAAAVPGTFAAASIAECTYAHWSGAPPGVSVMVERGRVARVDVASGPVATAEGARIGDREERIRQLYPGRVEAMPHKYTDGHYLVVRPADPADRFHLIVFETDGTRVKRYRAGRRPAVEYVEGCS